jgi:hypothetical protein
LEACHDHYVFEITDLTPFGELTTRPCIFLGGAGPCVVGARVDTDCPDAPLLLLSVGGRRLGGVTTAGSSAEPPAAQSAMASQSATMRPRRELTNCGNPWSEEETLCYMKRNGDLITTFCAGTFPGCTVDQLNQARCHYINQGVSEGRTYKCESIVGRFFAIQSVYDSQLCIKPYGGDTLTSTHPVFSSNCMTSNRNILWQAVDAGTADTFYLRNVARPTRCLHPQDTTVSTGDNPMIFSACPADGASIPNEYKLQYFANNLFQSVQNPDYCIHPQGGFPGTDVRLVVSGPSGCVAHRRLAFSLLFADLLPDLVPSPPAPRASVDLTTGIAQWEQNGTPVQTLINTVIPLEWYQPTEGGWIGGTPGTINQGPEVTSVYELSVTLTEREAHFATLRLQHAVDDVLQGATLNGDTLSTGTVTGSGGLTDTQVITAAAGAFSTSNTLAVTIFNAGPDDNPGGIYLNGGITIEIPPSASVTCPSPWSSVARVPMTCQDYAPYVSQIVGCYTGDGADYAGRATTTRSGRTCMAWSSQTPHSHTIGTSLPQNYCRNPNGFADPWCYTTDANVRWEFCDIPQCPAPPPDRVYPILGKSGATSTSGVAYCDLNTVVGKGWQLLTRFRGSSPLAFTGDTCLTLDGPGNCFGQLSGAFAAEYRRLELLITTIDQSKWVTVTGFSSSGLIRFLTGERQITTSSSCTDGDHVCADSTTDPHLRITAAHGWTPVSIRLGSVHVRGGGVWIGDDNGGGSVFDENFAIGYWGNGVQFSISAGVVGPYQPAAIFVRLTDTAPVLVLPAEACELQSRPALSGFSEVYPYYTREQAEQACLDYGCAGLADMVDLTGYVRCMTGWASDFRGWYADSDLLTQRPWGCGSLGYNTWTPAGSAAYCRDCPVCSPANESYVDLQAASTTSPPSATMTACPALGEIAGYGGDVVTTAEQCRAWCDELAACVSYDFSPSLSKCKLSSCPRSEVENRGPHLDYVSCFKPVWHAGTTSTGGLVSDSSCYRPLDECLLECLGDANCEYLMDHDCDSAIFSAVGSGAVGLEPPPSGVTYGLVPNSQVTDTNGATGYDVNIHYYRLRRGSELANKVVYPDAGWSSSVFAPPPSPPLLQGQLLASNMMCNPPQWLNVHPTDALDCIPHIRADARCDSAAAFFMHAARSDNNCACLTSAVDCTASANTVSNAQTDIRHLLAPPSPSPPAPHKWQCKENTNCLGACIAGAGVCPAPNVANMSACAHLCATTAGCTAVVHNNFNDCYLKQERGNVSVDSPEFGTVCCVNAQHCILRKPVATAFDAAAQSQQFWVAEPVKFLPWDSCDDSRGPVNACPSLTYEITTTDQALCVPAGGGRVQYTPRLCGANNLQLEYVSAQAIDIRPGLTRAECTWKYVCSAAHPAVLRCSN